MMKLLLIGCGGIGSFLAEELHNCILQSQIPLGTDILVADDDIVEMSQITYQNFTAGEVGLKKVNALCNRFELLVPITKRITQKKQLDGYDLIVLCVDNEATRRMVYESGKEFIDLRATGRRITAIPKSAAHLETFEDDTKEYSCQDKADLEKGWIQKGNKIVAMCGMQMILNHLRGHSNMPLSWVI